MLRKYKHMINRIKSKFVTKLFLIFIVIFIIIYIFSSYIMLNKIKQTLNDKELHYSQFVLQNIDTFLQNQFDSIHEVIRYTNLQQNTDFFIFLQLSDEKDMSTYFSTFSSFVRYVNSLFSFDLSIEEIDIYKIITDKQYNFTKFSSNLSQDNPYKDPYMQDLSSDYTQQLSLVPLGKEDSTMNYKYKIYTNLKHSQSFQNIATFTFLMNTEQLSSLIDTFYTEQPSGNFYLLTPQKEVIFDSSGSYDTHFMNSLSLADLTLPTITIDSITYHIITYNSNELGIDCVELIPVNFVNSNMSSIRFIIILSLIVSIAVITIITFFSSVVYSKRITTITKCLNQIKKGDLSTRIPVDKSKDEVALVAQSINQMCKELENHIEKVYVAELKQKDIELKLKSTEIKTLQAQINPHFLYNTLEMIRMKLNMEGEREAGDMIMILSKLFRSSIKEDMILSIAEELQTAKLFLRLYQLKYHSLHVDFAIDDSILQYAIIRSTFQPLLENCITHGYRSDIQMNIQVIGKLEDHMIYMCISDNGKGMTSEELTHVQTGLSDTSNYISEHIGVANVYNRLKLVFGETLSFHIDSYPGGGTHVSIHFPAKRTEEVSWHV